MHFMEGSWLRLLTSLFMVIVNVLYWNIAISVRTSIRFNGPLHRSFYKSRIDGTVDRSTSLLSSSSSSTITTCSNSSSNRIVSYCSFWENLLLEEYQQVSRDLNEQRRTWSPRRLEEAGISILNAIAEPDSELLGEKIIRISKVGRTGIVKNNGGIQWNEKFSRGDVLVLSSIDKLYDFVSRDCLLIDVGSNWLTVAVGPTWPKGLWESRKCVTGCRVRLDRNAPQTPLQAQLKTLDWLRRGRGGMMAQLMAASMDIGEKNDQTNLQQILAKLSSASTLWSDSESSPDQMKNKIELALQQSIESTMFRPDESQKEAIVWSLQRRLALIQGPAGTGKSQVAALLVTTALRLHPNNRVLAVAHSNGAADVLLNALLQMNIPAVRMGRPASVSSNLQHRTLIALTERHPEVLRLRAIARDICLDGQERSAAAFELRQCIAHVHRSILESAPVVVTGCIGAHNLLLVLDGSESLHYDLVICDEAAQTTEPALLCALVAAQANQLVLVGDTCQLPPTVSTPSLRHTLGVSPMARLAQLDVGQTILRTQYRMTPALLEHPSNYFYNGLVVSAVQQDLSLPPKAPPLGFPWPVPHIPLAFVQVDGMEVDHGASGRSNPSEAVLVAKIVSDFLIAGEVKDDAISVICPYSKQLQLVQSELSFNQQDTTKIRIGTVDSFQGQETDIAIFSCVRSNDIGELGFLKDSRRLCVAITRARLGLIVVGNRKTLQSDRHWDALLDSFDNRKLSTLNAIDFIRNVQSEKANDYSEVLAYEDKATGLEKLVMDPFQTLFNGESEDINDTLDLASSG